MFSNNVFYVVGDEMPYRFTLANSVSAIFTGNTFHGNFINKPEDIKASNAKADFIKNFSFPDGYPEILKKRVLDRLSEIND